MIRFAGHALLAVISLMALLPAVFAAEPAAGFMAAAGSADRLPPEAKAAWVLASKLTSAKLILAISDGQFVDEKGQPVAVEAFDVLWYHEGDSAAQTPLHGARSFPMLRKYVAGGGRLFLSGAALSLVNTMGIEPAMARRAPGGRDAYVAQIIPAQAAHPIFRSLIRSVPGDDSPISITSGGYPAFADFHDSGGPTTGMLLARANCASENPLVEYQLGKGRIIVMGWRLAHYSDAANAHRANLERLTANILAYLADPKQWQPVVIKPSTPVAAAKASIDEKQLRSLELAIIDLMATFGGRYPKGAAYLKRLRAIMQSYDAQRPGKSVEEFADLKRDALLDNPLMKFDRLLMVERNPANLGLPANWESNSSLPTSGFDNRLRILSPVRPDGDMTTLLEPTGGRFIGDLKLHFDGDRLLFSMPGANGRWQVHELKLPGAGSSGAPQVRELPLIRENDVDNYDACYLPDGRIVFTSTAPYIGVPCVYGASHVTNLYLLERDRSIRQLTVDQEHNWCPTVLNSGRVLYLRWEYTDLPHTHSRRLFHMNPDGTGQMAYMSSNSYFPNSFFYARPVPGHASKVVGIATGHHGNARTGRLLILDPALGQKEADGVVQEIPGYGKPVEAIIRDPLANGFWPQFLHPYPLSEKYFLVSVKPSPHAPWGIYLVNVFDNMLLIKESPAYALLEPVPVIKTATPPVIADRVNLSRKDAVVYMSDVYSGGGLRGIPRGQVKKLRLFTYHFSYRGMGGLLGAIGMDGPWDIKRVLGTVPVEADGSAMFRVPANTPISVQPLDADGKAMQLMRSWFTAMPGEVVSCVGCHERQSSTPISRHTLASYREPSEIQPWRGPTRGFSFAREVQPVLDRYCVGCHSGQPWHERPSAVQAEPRPGAARSTWHERPSAVAAPDGQQIADLRGTEMIRDWKSDIAGHVSPEVGGKFSVAYAELHRFVRRPGIESDIHMLSPMDYHADSTELVQILRKGHYGVQLDAEAWDRIVTWIDLNAPYHGTWTEIVGAAVKPLAARSASCCGDTRAWMTIRRRFSWPPVCQQQLRRWCRWAQSNRRRSLSLRPVGHSMPQRRSAGRPRQAHGSGASTSAARSSNSCASRPATSSWEATAAMRMSSPPAAFASPSHSG